MQSRDDALKVMLVGGLRERASRSTSEGLRWMLKLIWEFKFTDSTNSRGNIYPMSMRLAGQPHFPSM